MTPPAMRCLLGGLWGLRGFRGSAGFGRFRGFAGLRSLRGGAGRRRRPVSAPAVHLRQRAEFECVAAVGAAGHQPPELGGGHVRVAEAGDPALVHDRDPVGQRVDLVELGGDDDHGDAVVALLDDPAVHELDRPDVEAAGRLARDQHLVLAPDLPGQDDLLLVAAGERARRGGGGSGADVELLDQRGRVGADRGQLQVDAGGERRPVVGVEDEVLGDRERADEPVLPAVLGDVGDARAQPRPRRRAGEVAAVQRDRAGRRGPQAHQRLAQLGLPVALDAGDAEDLARPDLEGQPVHGQPLLARDGQVGDVEHDVAGLGRLLAHPQLHVTADHQRGQVVLGGGRRALADDLAPAQHGDGVGDRLDFLELVRDEDDRRAAVPQLADDAEQLLGLGRGEHRRRLVQDQHVRLPDQRLDDLDPLLDADRQVLDQRVRVDVEAVAVGELRAPRRGSCAGRAGRPGRPARCRA